MLPSPSHIMLSFIKPFLTPSGAPGFRIVCPRRHFYPTLPSNCPSSPALASNLRCQLSTTGVPRKKIGAVIIGNEILSGSTIDTNLSVLARHVQSKGAVLQKAVTIRDDVDIIADAVRSMSNTHDMVFTSGGIGPTLDDVTYSGVAAAFSLKVSRHEPTISRMKTERPDMELNAARLRMAHLPHDCEVLWTQGLWVPLAVVNNVYILPGVPKLFERMLKSVPSERFGSAELRKKVVVYCDLAEGDLASLLDSTAEQYQQISFGSYPATTEEAKLLYRSMITLEGDVEEQVLEAAELVRSGVNGTYKQNTE